MSLLIRKKNVHPFNRLVIQGLIYVDFYLINYSTNIKFDHCTCYLETDAIDNRQTVIGVLIFVEKDIDLAIDIEITIIIK